MIKSHLLTEVWFNRFALCGATPSLLLVFDLGPERLQLRDH